ncbi:MAG: hypothetical protein PHS41_12005 [Victivallaceae bacterium]|nr:hypothetical protein [Victivallaceae bacterium]
MMDAFFLKLSGEEPESAELRLALKRLLNRIAKRKDGARLFCNRKAAQCLNGLKLPDALLLETLPEADFPAEVAFFAPPAFLYAVRRDNGELCSEQLQLNPDWALSDFHIHTDMAYCNVDMNDADALAMGRLAGLKSMAFSEHSGQLYLSPDDYWHDRYNPEGLSGCVLAPRIQEYLKKLKKLPDDGFFRKSFELDLDRHGKAVVDCGDFQISEIRMAAIHQVMTPTDSLAAQKDFLFRAEQALGRGLDILAHPFRVFEWDHLPRPVELYAPLARMLRSGNCAAELNFHSNTPDPAFYRICLEEGVKIATGSDAHTLVEIGELAFHLKFLKELGVSDLTSNAIFRESDLKNRDRSRNLC